MENLKLVVDGMGCGVCVKNVRKVLDGLPGVSVDSVTVGTAVISHEPMHAPRSRVIEELARAGYPARVADAGSPELARVQNGGHCAAS